MRGVSTGSSLGPSNLLRGHFLPLVHSAENVKNVGIRKLKRTAPSPYVKVELNGTEQRTSLRF